MPAEPIGTAIAKRRHVLGLSQEQLAARVGVSRDSVSKWESGKHYPHRHLGKLEQVLGVNLSEEAPDPREQEIRDMDWLTPAEREQWIALYRKRKASPPGAARAAS